MHPHPATAAWPAVAGLCRCVAVAAAVAAGLLAGGCSTPAATALPRYIAPVPGQPSARLLMRGAVQSGDRIVVLRHGDALQCTGSQVLTEIQPPQAAPAVAIAAEALTTLDFRVLRASGELSCGVNVSFTPRSGRSYLLQGTLIGSGCTAMVVDVSQPERPQAVADFLLRDGRGQRCVPLQTARANVPARPSIQGGQDAAGEAVLNPRASTRDLEGLMRP